MIHVLAVVTARPGQRAAVLAAFRANVPNVLAEAGCIEYGAAIDAENALPFQTRYGPDTFVVVEKWESMAALDPGSAVVGGRTTLTPADVREQRRLQSQLDLEMRNRDLLRAQQNTLGEATPEFIKSQLIEAEQKVADLQTKLQAYPLQS